MVISINLPSASRIAYAVSSEAVVMPLDLVCTSQARVGTFVVSRLEEVYARILQQNHNSFNFFPFSLPPTPK